MGRIAAWSGKINVPYAISQKRHIAMDCFPFFR